MIHLVSKAGTASAVQCLTTSWTPFEIAVAHFGETFCSQHAEKPLAQWSPRLVPWT